MRSEIVDRLMARTPTERAIDRLLTVYLIKDAFSRKRIRFLPDTKLQKLVFLSERSMIQEKKKGFNFRFIRLIHGPFSQELSDDLRKLVQTGFLEDFGLKPTGNVDLVLEDFQGLIKRNRGFFEAIELTNERFATVPLNRLVERVYAMPWGRRRTQTIEDLPQRTPMLYPMKMEKVIAQFELSAEEAEDLIMNFDPDIVKDLSQASRVSRAGGPANREYARPAI